jgi:hypothetical protein
MFGTQRIVAVRIKQRMCLQTCNHMFLLHLPCAAALSHAITQEPVPTSLLRLAPEHAARAVKMFVGILRYCGDAPGSEQISQAQSIETAQKLLHQVRTAAPSAPLA